MNSCNYIFQNTGQPGVQYEAYGNTVRKVVVSDTSDVAVYSVTNNDIPHLSDNSSLVKDFDRVIKEELEEFDIPKRQDVIEAAKFLLIDYFGTEDLSSHVANGFVPVIELNELGCVKIVWYTKEKNISLTFVNSDVLLLIDDNDNIISESFSTAGLGRQFKNVERILQKYA